MLGDEDATGEDTGINLYEYMHPSAYSGFGDDEKVPITCHFIYFSYLNYSLPNFHFQGFYAVYSRVFKTLDEEEDEGGVDKDCPRAPVFGDSKTEWKDVHKFYQYWTSFTSRRSFAWADKYKPSTAPNRKIKRLMEADNKKERARAKKARVEQIRVSY